MEKKTKESILESNFIGTTNNWKLKTVQNIYNAMEEYSEQQNKEQLELLKELGEALREIHRCYNPDNIVYLSEQHAVLQRVEKLISKYDTLTKK